MLYNTDKRVVVTGISTISGYGCSIDSFWNGLLGNEPCIRSYADWLHPELKEQYAARIGNLPSGAGGNGPAQGFRYSRLGLAGARLLAADASLAGTVGLDPADLDPHRIGVVLNTDFGPNEAVEDYLTNLYLSGVEKCSPIGFTRTVANSLLGEITRAMGFKGQSSLLIGEESIAYAFDLIKDDKADLILCGGVDELRENCVVNYLKRGLLLQPHGDPAAPFSYPEDIKGMVLGEAVGFVCLESLESAVRRRARIYCELMCYYSGCSSSFNHFIIQNDSEWLSQHIEGVLYDAQVDRSGVGLVIGTSTCDSVQHKYERDAVGSLFDRMPLLGNIKLKIGETFGASGISNFIAAALCLHKKVMPGAIRSAEACSQATRERELSFDAPYGIANSNHIGGGVTSFLLRNIQTN